MADPERGTPLRTLRGFAATLEKGVSSAPGGSAAVFTKAFLRKLGG